MTIAICIKCGNEKIGAFSECDRCGFAPLAESDRMLCFGATDWFASDSERRELAQMIRSKETAPMLEPIYFDPPFVGEPWREASNPDNPTNGFSTFEAFWKANSEFSVHQAEALWEYFRKQDPIELCGEE